MVEAQQDIQALTKELSQMWWAQARLLLEKEGFRFTVPCGNNIQDVIGAGLINMKREARLADSDIGFASKNLGKWVAGMLLHAKNAPGAVTNEVREDSLVVSKKLRPLWPFF